MTDASADAVRDARLTWVVGGSLLIASAVLPLLGVVPAATLPGVAWASDLLWCAALVLFALGIRGRGSVVARKPFGVTFLVLAGALPIVERLFWALYPMPTEPDGTPIAINQGLLVLEFLVLLTAAVAVARSGAVSRRLRWLPLILLVVASIGQVIPYLVFATAADWAVVAALPLAGLATVLNTGALLALGITAIVAAPRRDVRSEAPVQVYPPR